MKQIAEVAHYIDGQWIAGSGESFVIHNPATGEVVGEGKSATKEEVAQAYEAARNSFFNWATLDATKRITILEQYASLLDIQKNNLADLIGKTVGKPLWEAKTEIASMINKVAISIEAYTRRTGTVSQSIMEGRLLLTHRPHGVLAVLGPYNFPGHLPNAHIVPALLAGNSIVFKPSEYAPQVAMAMLKLLAQAGVPAGVCNMVNGLASTGQLAAEPTRLDGLLFTGSAATGKLLHRQFADFPSKILALEMGGNNPLIVWESKDISAAVYYTVLSAFITTGQRCTCARRLIIPNSAWGDDFLAQLIKKVSSLSIGEYHALVPPFMGPIITYSAVERLLAVQSQLKKQGANILLEMSALSQNTGFISPGVMDVTSIKAVVPDEEYFGPFLQVVRVHDFDEAIRVANCTCYGLSAGLLSDDPLLWETFFLRVKAGVLSWNRSITGADSRQPFGGVGDSGNHRPSGYYAADYCAYPVAATQQDTLQMPVQPILAW